VWKPATSRRCAGSADSAAARDAGPRPGHRETTTVTIRGNAGRPTQAADARRAAGRRGAGPPLRWPAPASARRPDCDAPAMALLPETPVGLPADYVARIRGAGAMFPTRSGVMRCGRNAGVQAPACGSGHGRRLLPRSPDGDPCASADHRRSPVCRVRLQPRPWRAGSAYRRRPRYGGIDGSQATCPRDSTGAAPRIQCTARFFRRPPGLGPTPARPGRWSGDSCAAATSRPRC
jgi:hypothetical protein